MTAAERKDLGSPDETRHDAWVVGDQSVVVVDWHGATNYARS